MGFFSKLFGSGSEEPEVTFCDESAFQKELSAIQSGKASEKAAIAAMAMAKHVGMVYPDGDLPYYYEGGILYEWRKPVRNLRIFNYGRVFGTVRFRYEVHPDERLLSCGGVTLFFVTFKRVIIFVRPDDNGDGAKTISIKFSNIVGIQVLDSGAIEVRRSNSSKPFVFQCLNDSRDEEEDNAGAVYYSALQKARRLCEFVTFRVKCAGSDTGTGNTPQSIGSEDPPIYEEEFTEDTDNQ